MMPSSTSISSISSKARLLVLAEIALVFVVFFVYGAWPVPDVNEAHYLGKTIHFWNPAWGAGDFFLESDDTHYAFYVVFGWLSLWLSPVALAWTGRVATWWLLAWAWRRLNWAVLGRRWWSIATAAVMLFLVDHCEMAGEWIVGGIEAKGFAYVLVLLGLEAIVRDYWNRAWLAFGAASLPHVLVGGWSVVAAGFAWLMLGVDDRPKLRSMLPGLAGGLLLSLPSLVPSACMSLGVDPDVVDRANQIYVFERLGHHLFPMGFAVLPFAILLFAWLAVRWQTPNRHAVWRLHAFVAGTIVITMLGFAIAYATAGKPSLAAALLRFYWFRMTDIMVPLGVAVGLPVAIEHVRLTRQSAARALTVGMLLLAGWQVGSNVYEHAVGRQMRGIRPPVAGHLDDWRDACRWIATSEQIPRGAVFLTPRLDRTFKWYAGRSDVVNRKDIPQDPRSIVEWWERHQDIHATGRQRPYGRWFTSLAVQGEWRLAMIGRRYGADYAITVREPRLALPVVYENDSFLVYELPKDEDDKP